MASNRTAPSFVASNWCSRALLPKVASGTCSRTSRRMRASKDLLTSLGQTIEERPVIGANLTDPETGEPVLQSDGTPVAVTKDHNDALGENPSPVLTSGFTFVGQFIDHDITTLSEQQSDPNAM